MRDGSPADGDDAPRQDEEEEREERVGGESPREEALFQRLLKTRTVILSDGISDKSARKTISQLLLMEAADPDEPVNLMINSPGGAVDSGFAIFDMIRFIKPPVRNIVTGLAASAATIILLAVPKERRYALPNARLMMHQPSQYVTGFARDIEISAREILRIKEVANKLIADETGQDLEKVREDIERDYWMSAEDAVDYGFVGSILTNRGELD